MSFKKNKNVINGWLVIDKPLEMTSTDVGRRIKRAINPMKIGHVGTLDPLASGVLVLALGEATKLIPYWGAISKTYSFDVTFGESRSTDDAEGDVIERSSVIPTQEQIEAILPTFIGQIDQIPPNYSAIQVNGQRSYKRARSGEVFTLPSRSIRIHSLLCNAHISPCTFSFEVTCETGTYVRSLARDIAAALNTVGYVSRLRRTKDGVFTEHDTTPLEKITEIAHTVGNLFPLSFVLDDIPAMTVGEADVKRFYEGQPIPFNMTDPSVADVPNESLIQVHSDIGFCGIGTYEAGVIKPKRILHIGEHDVDYSRKKS